MLVTFYGGPMDGMEKEIDLDDIPEDISAQLTMTRIVNREVLHYASEEEVNRWTTAVQVRYQASPACDCGACSALRQLRHFEARSRRLRILQAFLWVMLSTALVGLGFSIAELFRVIAREVTR